MSDDCKCPDRRSFLKLGGLTILVSAVDPSFLGASGDPQLERLRHAVAASGKTLVFVFQRFGADGLNIVVPTESTTEYPTYQTLRPTLQLSLAELAPQQLTPDFALAPVMQAGLYQLWQQGMVAVLPNVGYPNGSRSHFDSQMFLDSGTPYQKGTTDGWLNRYMQSVPVTGEPLRAISFSSGLPFGLAGPAQALSFTDVNALNISGNAARNTKFLSLQGQVYGQPPLGRPYDAEVVGTGAGLIAAINSIRAQPLPPAGPNYPNTGFGNSMKQLAQLMKSKRFAIEIAEVDIGGWDTHAQQQQTSTTGAFPGLVGDLSNSIKAFVDDLVAADPVLLKNTVILTVSEFGRTAKENGNRGTDHGSAWASFAIGDSTVIKSGVHFGPQGWISLTNLRDNRDLKYSVDYRDVFSEVLSRHLGTLNPTIFPGWSYTPVGFL